MKRLTLKTEGGEGGYERISAGTTNQQLINKLAYYEDLEEKGRLIKLPCKRGESLWMIIMSGIKNKKAEWDMLEVICTGFSCYKSELKISTITKDKNKYKNKVLLSDIGISIFLTKIEAEVKLKNLRGGKNNN